MVENNEKKIEFTILMPCLNEENTIGICIEKAQKFLKENNIVGEVLISDNGSEDRSIEIAKSLGARVTHEKVKGYGSALRKGTQEAHGKYVIMGDCDDSYDFLHLEKFVEKLRDGYELVMGNRFKGGIEKGAMPFSNRYIGNPVLSGIGRLLYKTPIGDWHCGLRGYNRESILKLNLTTTGMEYASEMIVEAVKHDLKIIEVPTSLKKDGRERPPHLRKIRDGMRHLKYLIKNSELVKVKKKIVIILMIILMIVLIYLYKVKIDGVIDYSCELLKNVESTEYKSYILDKDNEIIQTIVPERDSFYKIKLRFDETNKKNVYNKCFVNANLFMTLKDEDGNIIEEYGQENIFLDEDSNIEFEFPEIKESTNKKYYLTIKCYGIGKIAIKLGKNDIKDNNVLYINGTESDFRILLETCYKVDDSNYGYFMFLTIITAVIVWTLVIINERDMKLEKKYIIAALIVSSITIIFTNLYDGSDELAHMGRIYDISSGNIITNIVNDWQNAIVPDKIKKIEFGKYSDINSRINIEDNDEKNLINMECTCVYSPISYIPQIIGLLFARMFIPNSFFWPYIVRIFQSLFCIILIYYAVKITPFGKRMILFIALLPSTIRQISLISADATLIAATILLVVKILQIIYDKRMLTKKDYIVLFCLSLLISMSKLVYCPLILLLLLIPSKIRKKDKSTLYNIILIIAIVISITFIWNFIDIQMLAMGQGVNTIWYIKYFTKRPLELMQKIAYTFYREGGRFISDILGGKNLWFGSEIKDGSIIQNILFAIYIFLIVKEKNPLDKKDRILIGMIVILTCVLISVSLLIAYTPISSGDIMGIQGRYFIPILIFVYLMLAKSKDENTKLDVPTILILVYMVYFLKMTFTLI